MIGNNAENETQQGCFSSLFISLTLFVIHVSCGVHMCLGDWEKTKMQECHTEPPNMAATAKRWKCEMGLGRKKRHVDESAALDYRAEMVAHQKMALDFLKICGLWD